MTELLDRDILFGNPDRAMVRVSPDGQWLSYLAPEQGVLNVWVAPVDHPSAAQAITHDRGRGDPVLRVGGILAAHPRGPRSRWG